MKKIIVCGATHGSNYGDSLFAMIFKESIQQYKNYRPLFTNVSEYSRCVLNVDQMTIKDLFSSDALIYISGGYFGQSHKETYKVSLFRFINYYLSGLITILRGKPVAIIGVGAGPLERIFLKKTVVYIFNKAKVVSVRDEMSKEYLVKYGVNKPIYITSDTAHVIDEKRYNVGNKSNFIKSKEKFNNKHIVLVHLASKNEEVYNDIIVNTILEELGSDQKYAFIITTDYVTKEIPRHIIELFPEERSEYYKFYDVYEFTELIASVDSIFTPKLHVGILGCTFNKAVLSFPLHPEKTIRYYTQIGYLEHCKSLFEVDKPTVRSMIEKYLNDRIVIPTGIKELSKKNILLLEDFLDCL